MKRLTLLFTCILLVLSCKEEESNPLTPAQTNIVDEINLASQPFSDSQITRPNSELAPLDFVGASRIVSMGEASHGAKDFFAMKHRIFRYLVEKFNYKAFAFEMDFAEAMIFEEYIQGKNTSDLEDLMATKMIFWTWRTKEVKELLDWMKSYNATQAEGERIHFYGFDCQYQTYNADYLVNIISKADPSLAASFASPLAEYKKLNPQGDDTNYASLKQRLEDINQQIDNRKDQLISSGLSVVEYEHAKQLSRIIVQTQEVIRAYKMSDYQLRDQYMAENAQWISQFTNAKICVWAHNYHIANDPNNKTMGSYLQQSFGDQYRKIGFAFSTGTFNAFNSALRSNEISKEPKEASSNYLFRHSKNKNFILRLDQLQDASSPLSRWVNEYHDFIAVGAVYNGDPSIYYNTVKLQQFFDVVIYFDEITNSELL